MPDPTLIGKAAAETMSSIVNRSPPEPARSEDVRIRNFDARAHEVDVQVVAVDGDTAFERTYHLPPETTACVVNELEDGEYDVAATLDGRRHAIATCRIDDRPEGTIVVETGNGVVSVANSGY